MERIKSQLPDVQELAIQTLSWVVFARRPLIAIELQHALAIEFKSPAFDTDNIAEVEDILSACAGLILEDPQSQVIRLVHYTTQEYFERNHQHWLPEAQQHITQACVTYLSYACSAKVGRGRSNYKDIYDIMTFEYPFCEYAVRYWTYNSEFSSESTRNDIMGLLSNMKNVAPIVQYEALSWKINPERDRRLKLPWTTAKVLIFGSKNGSCEKYFKEHAGERCTWLHYICHNSELMWTVPLLPDRVITEDGPVRNRDREIPLECAIIYGPPRPSRCIITDGRLSSLAEILKSFEEYASFIRILLPKGVGSWSSYNQNQMINAATWFKDIVALSVILSTIGVLRWELESLTESVNTVRNLMIQFILTAIELISEFFQFFRHCHGLMEGFFVSAAKRHDLNLLLQLETQPISATEFHENFIQARTSPPLHQAISTNSNHLYSILLGNDSEFGIFKYFTARIGYHLRRSDKPEREEGRRKEEFARLTQGIGAQTDFTVHAHKSYIRITKFFLQFEPYGLLIDHKDANGHTPLHLTVQLIFKVKDGTIPTEDAWSTTALEIARLLVSSGRVDINSRCNKGLTPLMHAQCTERVGPALIEYLKSQGGIGFENAEEIEEAPGVPLLFYGVSKFLYQRVKSLIILLGKSNAFDSKL